MSKQNPFRVKTIEMHKQGIAPKDIAMTLRIDPTNVAYFIRDWRANGEKSLTRTPLKKGVYNFDVQELADASAAAHAQLAKMQDFIKFCNSAGLPKIAAMINGAKRSFERSYVQRISALIDLNASDLNTVAKEYGVTVQAVCDWRKWWAGKGKEVK